MDIQNLKNKVLDGYTVTKDEALKLINADFNTLSECANEIREHFCKNFFDMCTIINGKSGRCSENCKYCSQSAFYKTKIDEYELLDTDKIVEQALYNHERGVLRYSIVCSGRNLTDTEVDKMCESIRAIKKACDISVCISFGLLNEKNFKKLKDAGVDRVHNNMETSRNYFPNVCTTHTFDDKVAAITAAKSAGLEVCSGGIFGLGETMEDRIDLALSARELGVTSIPVNMLNPIPNTPYENNQLLSAEEMARSVAIIRFILPNAFIRLAGGRGLMDDKGELCFKSGANAAISGDMLTTQGITIETDMTLTKKLGYKVAFANE